MPLWHRPSLCDILMGKPERDGEKFMQYADARKVTLLPEPSEHAVALK